jgi:hypothetical protein
MPQSQVTHVVMMDCVVTGGMGVEVLKLEVLVVAVRGRM